MAKNLQTRFAEALIARGEVEQDSKTKWRKFTRKAGGFYFVGKAGGLRFGANKSTSIPVSNKFKAELLNPVPDDLYNGDHQF